MAGDEEDFHDELVYGEDEDGELLIRPQNEHEPAERCGHVAVRMQKYIVLFGGYICRPIMHAILLHTEEYLSNGIVWMYDLEQEHWTYMLPGGSERPPGTSGASGAAIGNDIYMQGGHTATGNTNSIWKLTKVARNEIAWQQIKIGNQTKTPSPRDKHVCWEHDEKLWMFGGYGPPPCGYLYDYGKFHVDGNTIPTRGWNDQLHFFDPALREWTNVSSQGAIPSPRAAHAVCILNDKVFLFGGRSGPKRLDDCYELNMRSLQWSVLETGGVEKPVGRSWHSFNAVRDNLIVLHGGYSTDEEILSDTWLLDLGSGNTWHPYTAVTDHARLWHTGTTGLNSSVVVFGGCRTNIFSDSVAQQMCNDVFCVALEPASLLKQALKAVYRYRVLLHTEWDSLPAHLHQQLLDMCKHSNEPEDNITDPDPSMLRGVTCAIT